jgi:hypothetical protein
LSAGVIDADEDEDDDFDEDDMEDLPASATKRARVD